MFAYLIRECGLGDDDEAISGLITSVTPVDDDQNPCNETVYRQKLQQYRKEELEKRANAERHRIEVERAKAERAKAALAAAAQEPKVEVQQPKVEVREPEFEPPPEGSFYNWRRSTQRNRYDQKQYCEEQKQRRHDQKMYWVQEKEIRRLEKRVRRQRDSSYKGPETEESCSAFNPIRIDDLKDDPTQEEWVWQNILAPGSITLLSAEAKAGKSTLLAMLLQRSKTVASSAILGLSHDLPLSLARSQKDSGTNEKRSST